MQEWAFFLWWRGEWGWKRGLLSVFSVGEGKNVLLYTWLYRKFAIFAGGLRKTVRRHIAQ